MALYNKIISLLEEYTIEYTEYNHAPILNYEDAEREKANHHWHGIESKNVFMNDEKWGYYLFVTIQGKKVDFKHMKELTWEKLSLASTDDVRGIIQCIPWCVAPFGFDHSIITIVDKEVFSYEKYLFSPGIATQTIELCLHDLEKIFREQPNTLFIH